MHRASRWRRWIAATASIGATTVALVMSASTAEAVRPLGKAVLLDATGAQVGTVVFRGRGTEVSQVTVSVSAPAIANLGDFHGFHVHTTGVCDPAPSGSSGTAFGSAEGHWNPTGASHGAHTGDMPSLLVHADGRAWAQFETDRFDITTLLDADGDGSAVILHAGRDNFANIPATYSSGGVPGPNATTLATGDASSRVACGVVTAA